MDSTESALVALVPEADPIVGAWRSRLDPSATDGLGAHITMLYPFANPGDFEEERIGERIREVAEVTAPLRFELDEVCWFGDTVVWARPTPGAPVLDLSEALQADFPEYLRYEGVHAQVVPHLTIAAQGSLAEKQEAATEVASHLPLPCRVQEISLMVRKRDTGQWTVARRFELAANGGDRR